MTAGAPTVGVVVVNYNGGDLTLECLRNLLRTEWPADRLRVVLVDNASHDGIAARVRDELPVVEVLDLPSNRGFGAGCNAGIRALGAVDFVALVNNDAVRGAGLVVAAGRHAGRGSGTRRGVPEDPVRRPVPRRRAAQRHVPARLRGPTRPRRLPVGCARRRRRRVVARATGRRHVGTRARRRGRR